MFRSLPRLGTRKQLRDRFAHYYQRYLIPRCFSWLNVIPYDLPPYFALLWVFLHGAILGSFLTVCVHRLPQHSSILAAWRSLVHNPSHCDRCEQKLLARDNIPILGWLILRGQCRFCKQSIPVQYPLIELANGLLFVLVYCMEVPLNHWTPLESCSLGCSMSPSTFSNGLGLSSVAIVNCRYLYHLILVEALFVASLIDWDSKRIPVAVTLPALLLGMSGAFIFGKFWIVPAWFQDVRVAQVLYESLPGGESWTAWSRQIPAWIGTHPHWHGLAASVAGLIVGGGLMWGVRILGRIAFQREAIGWGDVLLMAMVGSFSGWQPIVVVFFIAPMLALVGALLMRTCEQDREASYGPYLSLGTLMVLLSWHWIWPFVEWYFSLGIVLIVTAFALTATHLAIVVAWHHISRRMRLVKSPRVHPQLSIAPQSPT